MLMPEPHIPGKLGPKQWSPMAWLLESPRHQHIWYLLRDTEGYFKISNYKNIDNTISYTLTNDVLQEHNADIIFWQKKALTGPVVRQKTLAMQVI